MGSDLECRQDLNTMHNIIYLQDLYTTFLVLRVVYNIEIKHTENKTSE